MATNEFGYEITTYKGVALTRSGRSMRINGGPRTWTFHYQDARGSLYRSQGASLTRVKADINDGLGRGFVVVDGNLAKPA